VLQPAFADGDESSPVLFSDLNGMSKLFAGKIRLLSAAGPTLFQFQVR
jgi:hypothetical protein